MQRRLNLGVIGCGMVGEYHIAALLENKQVNLKWACDLDDVKLEGITKRFEVQQVTRDYREVLEDRDIRAVVICTQPNTHLELVARAVAASKHVLVEKPLVKNLEELSELSSIIDSAPSLLVVDASARHSRLQPKFAAVKSIIDSGQLGDVYAIHHNAVARQSRPGVEYHPEASWFYNKKLSGGGPLLDWGVYDLSFHLGVLGDKHNLQSLKVGVFNKLDDVSLNEPDYTVEEHALVMMEFSEGLMYYWERASNAHNEVPNETRIYGTKGGLKFSYLSWESNKAVQYYLDRNNKACSKEFEFEMHGHSSHLDDFKALDDHFVSCVLKLEEPVLPYALSSKHLDIIFQSLDYSHS